MFNHQFSVDNIFLPYQFIWFYFSIIYLVFVFGMKFKRNTSFVLKLITSIWNLSLSIFSGMGMIVLTKYCWELTQSYGIHSIIDHENKVYDYRNNEEVYYWTFLFICSKIPELIDTILLKASGKEPIFLQWFHHETTMIYAYYLGVSYTHSANGLIMATMNYIVHTIMYFYFAIHPILPKKSSIKKYSYIITILQTLQMVIAIYSYMYRYFILDYEFDHFGFGMYVCYAVMFTKLFLQKTFLKKKKD